MVAFWRSGGLVRAALSRQISTDLRLIFGQQGDKSESDRSNRLTFGLAQNRVCTVSARSGRPVGDLKRTSTRPARRRLTLKPGLVPRRQADGNADQNLRTPGLCAAVKIIEIVTPDSVESAGILV
jgi:hypothetical protein